MKMVFPLNVQPKKKKRHNLVDFESSPYMFLNFSWVQPIYKFLSPKNINIKNQGSAQYQEDRDQQSHVVPQRRFAYSYQKARQGFGQVRAYLAQSHGTVLSLSLTLSIAFDNLLVLTFIWVCSNFSFLYVVQYICAVCNPISLLGIS